jgi:hypothetical protein
MPITRSSGCSDLRVIRETKTLLRQVRAVVSDLALSDSCADAFLGHSIGAAPEDVGSLGGR